MMNKRGFVPVYPCEKIMEDLHKRLMEERDQLLCRMERLEAYINKHAYLLPDIHRGLLRIQLQAMNTYAECLLTRAGLSEEPKEEVKNNETP